MIYIVPTDTCFWLAVALDDIKSYNKIYEIKNRSYDKPLSIMIDSFSWLEKNTNLNKSQIEFLKNYNSPFTILTDCNIIKMILNLEQDDFEYKNKNTYKKIAFRVANNDIQKKLIWEIWPFFLTSANFSWEKEIFSIDEAKEQFKIYEKDINFLENYYKNCENLKILPKTKTSDIFEFIWDTTETKYIRK